MKTLSMSLQRFKPVKNVSLAEKVLKQISESEQIKESIREMARSVRNEYSDVGRFSSKTYTLLHKHGVDFGGNKIYVEANHTFSDGYIRPGFTISEVKSSSWIMRIKTHKNGQKFEFKGNMDAFDQDATTIVLATSATA